MVKYDIFISYRRDAFESANLFATRLKALGYRVFFDIETMNAGRFNEQLLDVISKCKDFVLVLSPNALERCKDNEDWVRRETLCAMEHKKNIIPVMLSGFVWPEQMPEGMEDLCNYQALAPAPNTYYDLQVKRLQGYLKSKAHFLIRKRWLIGISTVLCILLLCFAISWITYLPAVTDFAERASKQMMAADEYMTIYESVYKDWEKFVENRNKPLYDSKELNADMANIIQETRSSLETIHNKYGNLALDDISDFHIIIMWMHGITPTDLVTFQEMGKECFENIQMQVGVIDTVRIMGTYDSWSLYAIQTGYRMTKILTDSYYYGYVQMLSHLPSKAQESFQFLSPSLKHMPTLVGLNLSDQEYERLQKITENALMNELNASDMIQQKADYEILQLEQQLGEMEQKFYQSLDSVQQIVDHTQLMIDNKKLLTDSMVNAFQEKGKIKQANAVEIAMTKERIVAERQIVKQKEAQLEELEKRNLQAFEELKAHCELKEEDAKGYKWGKIVKYATFLESFTQTRTKAESEGIYSTSSISPAVIYATLASMLNTFKTYHPESSDMAESAKAFYKEVSKAKRLINGVIIAEIKDNMTHPVNQVGDIVTSIKGYPVTSFEEIKAALKKDGPPSEVFLRLTDGELREYQVDDYGSTDILGFIDLRQ